MENMSKVAAPGVKLDKATIKAIGEVFENAAKKKNGWAGMSTLKRVGTIAGGALGIGAAADLAQDGIYEPIKTRVQISNSRKGIMSKYPNLSQEDPQKIKDYFNVVRQFSPRAAANPLVAGALVNKMVQFGGVDHKLVQDLAGIEKDVAGQSRSLGQAVAKGAISSFGGA